MPKWNERWCLVELPGPHEVLSAQCEHTKSTGRYVVLSKGVWCGFSPPTRLQALSWVDGKEERHNRIMWLCDTCGKIMPLGTYEHKK